jgi:RND family efflux transporter MFP subunit
MAWWLLVMAGCHGEKPKAGAPAPEGPPKAVATAAVIGFEADETAVPGTIRARQRAALSARVPASVIEVPHREGDRVEAGAVLVRLDDAALRSAVAAAEAAMTAAESDRRRAEALLAKGAATPREKDDAATRAAATRAAWEGARDNLAYAILRAPFAGRIARKPVNVGDVVSPGTTLVEIEGEGGFELEATLAADLAASLRPGFRAQAIVDGRDEPLDAVVRSVSPAGDPTTHRFDLRADLPPAAGLRSGLFARLLLASPASSPRLAVPAQAVFQRGGLFGVFVVTEGRARLRWLAPGATAAGRTEVRAGLEAGERVIVDPSGLADGTPVVETPQAR